MLSYQIFLVHRTLRYFFQDLVKDLPVDTLHKLIVELAESGEGSLDYVQGLLDIIQHPDGQPVRNDALPWCKCGCCVDMGNVDENKCCDRRICITSYYMFKKLCLGRNVLKLNIIARSDLRGHNIEFTTNAYRKAAYHQMALWEYGRLGKGDRRVHPSCVVTMIRKFYPSPDDRYMGFKHS